MAEPVFEYVLILGGDRAKAHLKVAFLAGISTAHDSADTDNGRLYASVTRPGGVYTLDVYSSRTRSGPSRVLTGTAPALREYFDLEAANDSGMSGRAWLEDYAADDNGVILVPTFATDRDVYAGAEAAAAMPGYDDGYGLAYFHAMAVRDILTSELPRQVPNLFGGDGLAEFVPQGPEGPELPDLRDLGANVDQLRVAQATLVKALSAEQAEHVEQFAAMAKAARGRFDAAMKQLGEANTKAAAAREAEAKAAAAAEAAAKAEAEAAGWACAAGTLSRF